MPVAKKRADLAELISVAAVQRKKIAKRQRRHHSIFRIKRAISNGSPSQHIQQSNGLKRAVRGVLDSISHRIVKNETDVAESDPTGPLDDSNDAANELALYASAHIHYFLEHLSVRVMKLFIILLAFLTLSYEATGPRRDRCGNSNICTGVDIVIDICFLAEGALKCLAFYAHMDMHKLFNFKGNNGFILFLRRSGVVDMIIASASLVFARGEAGDWFRLIRVLLISSFALAEVPHLEVLLSGISFGLRSIMSTWLLLSLVFIIYASVALTFFQMNDPYHFGSIALAMWTFFELATLDNWSVVMYINTYGCDKFPSQYVMSNITKGEDGYADEYYKLRYGRMVLPVCNHPEAQPVLSTILFITFITLCGFILINITIAAVTAGINDRLDELRKEDLEEEMMGRMISGLSSMPNKSSTILTDPAMLLMLMKQVWKEHDDYAKKMARLSAGELEAERKKRERQEKRDSLRQQVSAYRRTSSSESRVDRGPSALNEVSDLDASQYEDEQLQCGLYLFSLRYQSMYMRDLTGHLSYQFLVAGLVILAAVTEMWTLQNPESRANAEFVLLALQILFTLDLYCKVIATYPNYQIFFTNGWSIFDTILVIATWAPVMTTGMQGKGARIIGLLRVFRILRLLKMLTWIRELNVVLHSIASSVRALVYVILLLFAFFYHFGIAGVFLFAENDPQHFGTLWKAFVTLFQVSSLDDWSEIARTNMYGCDLYGYDTGEDHYDSQCQHPRGLGWFAAWYFIVVVIIGTMVLLSLFVGIIITSMELLKEGIKEEKEVWAKVRIKQKQYNMRDTTINNLLEIFDLIDIGQNGKLTLNELKPVLEIVALSEANQFSLFMMVDNDSSGQIDFSEFLELIHLVGKAYKANAVKKLKKHRVLPSELKHMVDESHAQQQRHQENSADRRDSGKVVERLKNGVKSALSSISLSSLPKIAPSVSVSSNDELGGGNDEVARVLRDESLDREFMPIETEGGAFLDLCRNETPHFSDKDSPDFVSATDRYKIRSDIASPEPPTRQLEDGGLVGPSFFENEIKSSLGHDRNMDAEEDGGDQRDAMEDADVRVINDERELFESEGDVPMALAMSVTRSDEDRITVSASGGESDGMIRPFSDKSLLRSSHQGKSKSTKMATDVPLDAVTKDIGELKE